MMNPHRFDDTHVNNRGNSLYEYANELLDMDYVCVNNHQWAHRDGYRVIQCDDGYIEYYNNNDEMVVYSTPHNFLYYNYNFGDGNIYHPYD